MKLILVLLLLTSSSTFVLAQSAEGCLVPFRYQSQIFSTTSKTTVQYGENINPGRGGQLEALIMDVHEPIGDTLSKRPVLILAHGGSFQFGGRVDIEGVCIDFARRGYVAVTMDYRKFFPGTALDSVNVVEATIRAVQDMKAAVRYMKNDALDSNLFRVDTSFIMVGGFSAGAITAVQLAYWNINDSSKAYIDTIVANEGGLEGQSNTITSVTSKIRGVLNSTGAILDTTWILATEPLISSYHGTNDVVVPIGVGTSGGAISSFGSDPIHQRTQNLSMPNYLKRVIGGSHTDIYVGANAATFLAYLDSTAHFFRDEILCQGITSGISNNEMKQILVFPNPAKDMISISGQWTSSLVIRLIDPIGRRQQITCMKEGENLTVDTSQLSPGLYILKVTDGERTFSEKVLIER